MKKRIVAIVLIIVMAFMATACGKSNSTKTSNKTQDKPGTSNEENVNDDKENDDKENDDKENVVADEDSVAEELLKFETKDEVINSEIKDGLMQVGDVVLSTGILVSDFFELLENSSLEWEYEYNPDQLVIYHANINPIVISYKGMKIFQFTPSNCKADESAISLKDCLILDYYVLNEFSKCFHYANNYCGNGENVEDYIAFSAKYKEYLAYKEESVNDRIDVHFEVLLEPKPIPSMGITINETSVKVVYASFSTTDGKCTAFIYDNFIHYTKKLE